LHQIPKQSKYVLTVHHAVGVLCRVAAQAAPLVADLDAVGRGVNLHAHAELQLLLRRVLEREGVEWWD